MRKLDISCLTEKIINLPELVKPVSDVQKIEKYLNLLELLTDNYISPQHLAVPDEDWDELMMFIEGLSDSLDNSEANVIRFGARNIEVMKSVTKGFMCVKSTPFVTDDFI